MQNESEIGSSEGRSAPSELGSETASPAAEYPDDFDPEDPDPLREEQEMMDNARHTLTMMMLWCAGVAIVIAMVLTAGCASLSGDRAAILRAQDTIYQTNILFNTALMGAVQYARLPRCHLPESPPICSDQEVVDKIVVQQAIAAKALDAAEKEVRAPDAQLNKVNEKVALLNAAFSTFNAIITSLPKKN